jgi:hypothetical protein
MNDIKDAEAFCHGASGAKPFRMTDPGPSDNVVTVRI